MIYALFIFGLISSLHCVGMCGPLQWAVFASAKQKPWGPRGLIYQLGRLSTYALLGLAAALLGQSLGWQEWSGRFSLLLGLALLFLYFGGRALALDRKVWAVLSPLLSNLRRNLPKGPRLFWFSGMLNGLLPCGMVYAALVPVSASGHPGWGALYMLAFGTGTLFLPWAFTFFGDQYLPRLQRKLPVLVSVSVVVMAGLLIFRGLQLDIPFLSPALPVAEVAADGCQ